MLNFLRYVLIIVILCLYLFIEKYSSGLNRVFANFLLCLATAYIAHRFRDYELKYMPKKSDIIKEEAECAKAEYERLKYTRLLTDLGLKSQRPRLVIRSRNVGSGENNIDE